MTFPPPARDAEMRTLTPDQAERSFSGSRLLLLLALMLTQALTLGGVLWADRQSTERVLKAQAQGTLEQLVRVTTDSVGAYLNSAAQVVTIYDENLRAGLLSAGDPSSLTTSFQTLLNSAPQLNGMLLGDSAGNFTFVRRDGAGDQGRFVRVIEVSPARRVTTTTFGAGGRLISQSQAPDPFDPRTRPWYQQAVARPGTLVWTAPYVFASSRLPGITVASAQRTGGDVVVVGADVQLRNLTDFLGRLQISANGRAFIADSRGNAIAASRAWPVSVQGRVPALKEVADPALADLLDEQGQPRVGAGVQRYLVGGQRYAAVIRPVEVQPGITWTVGVYAPETDFTQALRGASRNHLLLILLASALGSLVAWPIVRRATRPMLVLQRQATTDALTGLRNRASFLAQLDEELAGPRDRAVPGGPQDHLGVAVFDFDGFKAVNDTYGHPTGDEVLHAFGARMLAAVRARDTLGRLGGDEFALIVEGESREEVRLRVEGVLQAIARRPVIVGGTEHHLTATAGLAFHDPEQPASSTTSLLGRADAALIRGKRREKGRVWVEGEVSMPTLFR